MEPEPFEFPFEGAAVEDGVCLGRLGDEPEPEHSRLTLEFLAGEACEAAGRGLDRDVCSRA